MRLRQETFGPVASRRDRDAIACILIAATAMVIMATISTVAVKDARRERNRALRLLSDVHATIEQPATHTRVFECEWRSDDAAPGCYWRSLPESAVGIDDSALQFGVRRIYIQARR